MPPYTRASDDVVILGETPTNDLPLNKVAILMVRKKSVRLGQGMLQCHVCKTKRCTSEESMATHLLRRHLPRVQKWSEKRKL